MNAGLMDRVKAGIRGGALALAVGALTALSVRAGEPETPPPNPPPAPAPNAEAQKLLDEQALSDKKLREEIAAQAAAHYESGKRLFAAFDYEAARQELEMAVQLDRTNEEARKLLMRVNDILGVRKDRVKSAVAQLYGEHKVAVQQKLVELDNRIDYGKRFIQQAQSDPDLALSERIRKYEQGIAAFERAKELIKWLPVEVNVDEQSAEVNRLISEARRAIKAAQVRLQEIDREAAAELAQQQRESERKQLDQRINTLIDQAKAHYERGHYEAGMDLANKILELDPTNAEAHTIIAVSRDRFHIKRRKYLDEEYREQFTLTRERAERMNIPHKDYLVYPDNWHEIAQRTGQEAKTRPQDPWKLEVRKKLARHVDFDFVDTPLDEVISFLNQLAQVTIILDPKVAAKGANKAPITLRVQDMEMEVALRWILKLAELEYDLRGQAVFITDKASLASASELEIYDIRDLTTKVEDFPGPPIDKISPLGGGAAVNPFAAPAAGGTIAATDLKDLIKDKIMPNEFADAATTSIDEQGGKLVVMQRPEVHERIRQILKGFRETQTLQVLTQVRFIDVNDGFLENIGIHFTGLDAPIAEPGVNFARVDPLRQPSNYGLFPIGGGPGLAGTPTDIQSSPNFQFQDFADQTGVTRPPFKFDFGPPSQNPGPRPITILRPRLDPNFPGIPGQTGGAANAPAGLRRQWWEKAFGSPVLLQGLTENILRLNPIANPNSLGSSIQTNPQQGALFQFRFLQSVQANAVLQAVRKDQTSDVLMAPKLTQFNNQRSHVMVAQQQSYIRDYDISGAVFDPIIGNFLTGIILDLKPTVSSDKRYITLDARPGVSVQLTPPDTLFLTAPTQSVTTGGGTFALPIDLPNLEIRSIATTVTVPDNGTMLFSGLVNDQKFDAKSGVPFFSDLPLIGRFFSNNSKTRERRNLLVLINARVILFDEEEARL